MVNGANGNSSIKEMREEILTTYKSSTIDTGVEQIVAETCKPRKLDWDSKSKADFSFIMRLGL